MATTRKIENSKDLEQAITELENKVKAQEADIKYQFTDLKQKTQPRRFVHETFGFLAETPELQKTIVNTALGFVLGFATKRASKLISEEKLNRTVENMVLHQVDRLEQRNPNSLLSNAVSLFRKFTPPTSPIYPFVKYR